MQVNAVPDATIAEFRRVAQRIYGEATPDLGPKGRELVELGVAANK